MIFFSDKAEKNGPRVEARLRKELGATSPLPFTTELQGEAFRPSSFGAALRDSLTEAAAGRPTVRPMYTLRFDLTQPRACEIRVVVENHGGTSLVGAVHYATRLAAHVAGSAAVEGEKVFGKSTFTGDAAACARLNSDKALIKQIHRFLRGSYQAGKITIERPRLLKILPDAQGALLVATSLPRLRWFGLAASFDAAAFPVIAAAAERALTA